MKTTIYALTGKQEYCSGHGSFDSVVTLGTITEGWSFKGYHPLFDSFEAAAKYRETLDKWEAQKLSITAVPFQSNAED